MGACSSMHEPPPNPDFIDLSHFELLKVVGKGGFGKVNAITHRSTQELLALKRIEKYRVLKSKTHLHMVWTERKIMSLVFSPFLCRLRYAFESDTELFLVMPFLQGGDLRFHLKERGRMSEQTARFYSAQMVLGLEELHRKNIVYRDLKPENVLLDEQGHLRITDFGLACLLEKRERNRTRGQAGTRGYMAPETISLTGYGLSVDYFSLGVMMFELLHGQRPWKTIDPNIAMLAMEGEIDPLAAAKTRQIHDLNPNDTDRPALPPPTPAHAVGDDGDEDEEGVEQPDELRFSSRLSTDAKALLLALLEFNPTKRIGHKDGWREVKAHPFFSTINWTDMEARAVKPPFQPDLTHANCTPDADLADQLLDKKPKRIRDDEQKAFEGWSWNTKIHHEPTSPSPTKPADEAKDVDPPHMADLPSTVSEGDEAAAVTGRKPTGSEADDGPASQSAVSTIALDEEKAAVAGGRGSAVAANTLFPEAASAKAEGEGEVGGLRRLVVSAGEEPTAILLPVSPLSPASTARTSVSPPPASTALSAVVALSLPSSGRPSLTDALVPSSQSGHRKSISTGALSLHGKEEGGEAEGGRRSTLKEKRQLRPMVSDADHPRTPSSPAVYPAV